MIKKIIMLPVLALAVTLNNPTFADTKGEGQCPCKRMEKFSRSLNLTNEQKSKIKTIKEQARRELRANREKMQAVKHQIKDLIKSKPLNEAKLDKLLSEKSAIITATMKTKVMMKHQIYNVLNSEQKAKYSEMLEQWDKKKDH